jgi:hypothetical protein
MRIEGKMLHLYPRGYAGKCGLEFLRETAWNVGKMPYAFNLNTRRKLWREPAKLTANKNCWCECINILRSNRP